MGVEIDRKLWLTAALVGAASRKELAAAFRRVNPATSFDLERAHKWLQGRALPRDRRVYEDWARLVDLGESADWIAACGAEAFLERMCARHALARATLLSRAARFGGAAAVRQGAAEVRASELVGTYVCYSHAWSSYFRGRLVRGALAIAAGPGPQRLLGTYTEALPTGQVQAEGTVTLAERALYLDLREPQGGIRVVIWLFPPSPPASVLAGFMTGTTFIGPEPQPSMTRTVMIRLPVTDPRCDRPASAYLPPGASLAADIRAGRSPLPPPWTGRSRLFCAAAPAAASTRSPGRRTATWSSCSTSAGSMAPRRPADRRRSRRSGPKPATLRTAGRRRRDLERLPPRARAATAAP